MFEQAESIFARFFKFTPAVEARALSYLVQSSFYGRKPN
jgi:hypothetical protein